jgi:hypothetical protein
VINTHSESLDYGDTNQLELEESDFEEEEIEISSGFTGPSRSTNDLRVFESSEVQKVTKNILQHERISQEPSKDNNEGNGVYSTDISSKMKMTGSSLPEFEVAKMKDSPKIVVDSSQRKKPTDITPITGSQESVGKSLNVNHLHKFEPEFIPALPASIAFRKRQETESEYPESESPLDDLLAERYTESTILKPQKKKQKWLDTVLN